MGTALAITPTAGMPPDKAALWNRLQQEIDDARAQARPKPREDQVRLPPPAAAPTPLTGIVQERQGPFPAIEFEVRDSWLGWVGSTYTMVYAGARRSPLGPNEDRHGALRVYTRAPGQAGDNLVGVFDAPTGSDAVTVTSVEGTALQLRSDQGQTLTFDLQTHQYR
jgi:hypothetical protein